ncbi:carboxypeptidase B-like [Saccoglossus kowalevskii]|uniref:Carboxypeptidase A2-like n=1 Tax=Saccoglossus kowalevskii TaxID=10224 RepID=A0ABM0GJV2_SACKO|nr:PREDICTED: carboxypeptidase A2-like [Saccoglossus kowalevskii]
MQLRSLLFIAVHVLVYVVAEVRYDGYKVLRAEVGTQKELEVMRMLEEFLEVDFWDFPHDVMVSENDVTEVKALLDQYSIQHNVIVDDVQYLMENQFRKRLLDIQERFDYSVYHTYDEIDQWVVDIASAFPDLATFSEFDKPSYEGRSMKYLTISSGSTVKKPAVFLQSAQHAREWVSPATVLWMTNQLLTDYGNDPLVTRLLDTFTFYVVPLVNPDGYKYSWDEDRLWRKTRKPNEGRECVGTDPNRNWEYEWGGGGASPNPCFSTYRGEYPQSEVEVENVANFILDKSSTQDFKLFFDMHSYSQLWLSPWGYSTMDPSHKSDHLNVARQSCDALEAVHGTSYTYGTVAQVLYVSSGSAIDWAYGVANIKYSYTLELRDEGSYGFLLPEDQIIPTSEETYAGFLKSCELVMAEL